MFVANLDINVNTAAQCSQYEYYKPRPEIYVGQTEQWLGLAGLGWPGRAHLARRAGLVQAVWEVRATSQQLRQLRTLILTTLSSPGQHGAWRTSISL